MILQKQILGEEVEILTDSYINGERYYRCVTFPASGVFPTLEQCIKSVEDIIKDRTKWNL